MVALWPLFLCCSDLVPETLYTLAVGILRLEIAELGLVPHAHMPLAESQPDFSLIEIFDTHPLPVTASPEYLPLSSCALE
jgi:hypothetical protein